MWALIIKFPRVVRQRVDRFLNFPSQESPAEPPPPLIYPFRSCFFFSRALNSAPLCSTFNPNTNGQVLDITDLAGRTGRRTGARRRCESPKTEGKINKVEEQSKLNGVMLLLLLLPSGGGRAA